MLALYSTAVLTYPQIDPIALAVGPVVVRWYSLAYLSGLLFGWWFIKRQMTRPGAIMAPARVDDFLTWATLGVIIGGRLGYVLFYNFSYYLENPGAALRLWDGGMSFHGGLIGVVLAVALFAHKHRIPTMRMADLIAVVSPIGLFFGRLANFINGELWGRPTDVPWAMIFPSDPAGLPRHPSQLYEALGEGLLLFLVLYGLWRFTSLTKRMPGVLAGIFFIWYGMARILVEFVREPDAHIGLVSGVSRGQMLSVPMFLFAAWLISCGLRHWRKSHA